MNSYLSSTEKAQFIRILCMKNVLQETIDTYAGLDSTDKAFLGELRHARTRIDKAVKFRRSALDKEADEKLVAAVGRLEPMFLPTPEAKKAHKEILKLQSILPMDIEDLQDWYGFVIESTCATCIKADYEECPARRVLSKYEICPMDPGAKGKCQYSYAASTVEANEPKVPGIIEKPEFVEFGSEPLPSMETALPQIQELQVKLEFTEKRLKFQINECFEIIERNDYLTQQLVDMQVECDNLLAKKRELDCEIEILTLEQIKENKYGDGEEEFDSDSSPVILGLNNGNKILLEIPQHMARKLVEDIQRPNRLSRSVCAKYVEGVFVAIDMQEVVTIQVAGLSNTDGAIIQPSVPDYEYTNERELYRIECKCGSDYFATMNAGRTKANCRDCKYTVFADRKAERSSTTGGVETILLTNRYYVSNDTNVRATAAVSILNNAIIQEETKEVITVSDLRNIKNSGHDYKDPCQLVG